MPQLTQLPDVFWSQLFWLAIVFGVIYFVFGLGVVPKVEKTVEARDSKIADDLAAAEAARVAADETEAAYRARMDESRAEAL
jgi:F-type H+-transporting ATPase subunit b